MLSTAIPGNPCDRVMTPCHNETQSTIQAALHIHSCMKEHKSEGFIFHSKKTSWDYPLLTAAFLNTLLVIGIDSQTLSLLAFTPMLLHPIWAAWLAYSFHLSTCYCIHQHSLWISLVYFLLFWEDLEVYPGGTDSSWIKVREMVKIMNIHILIILSITH